MATNKKRVSDMPIVPESQFNQFEVFGVNRATGDNGRATMSQLKGNTAFKEWQMLNPGKTYDDWILLLQEPAATVVNDANEKMQEFAEAEAERSNAENIRKANEDTRKSNETTRESKESTRQANEDTRISNEDTRLVDEQLRNSAENTRASNEDTRLTQEEAREKATIQALVDAEEATNRLNNLSDNRDKIVDGFWWRYDEEAGKFYNTGERANGDVLLPTFHVDADGDLIMTKPEQLTELDFEVNGKDLIMKINI